MPTAKMLDTGFWREDFWIWDIKVRKVDLLKEDANEFDHLELIFEEIQPCLEIEDDFIW